VRWPKLAFGFVLLVGGLYATWYFLAHQHEFDGGDSAFSIAVPIERPRAPVGFYMNLALAAASALIAGAGVLMVRANRRPRIKPLLQESNEQRK